MVLTFRKGTGSDTECFIQFLEEIKTGIARKDWFYLDPPETVRKMMEDGTVVATVLVDKNGFVFSEPQISSFGLLEESSDDKKDLTEAIKNNVAVLSDEHRQRDDLIKETVRRTLRQFIREKYGKKPVIEIHLFQI